MKFLDPRVEEMRAQWQALRGDDHDDARKGQQIICLALMELKGWEWDQAVEFLAGD
jgi:hypothetical protein